MGFLGNTEEENFVKEWGDVCLFIKDDVEHAMAQDKISWYHTLARS